MKNDIATVLVLAKAFTKRYFRDKIALFFTFVFPLVFLIVFGAMTKNDNGPSFEIALIQKSTSQFAQDFIEQTKQGETVKYQEAGSFDEAKEKLGRGEIDGIMEVPESFGEPNEAGVPSGNVKLYYDEGDASLAASMEGTIGAALESVNNQLVQTEKPLSLEANPIQTANLSPFDYTIAGLIGFALLSLGIFSMSEGFTGDKKSGALRRMQVAPIRVWQLVVAIALNRVLVGLICVAFMLIVATFMFDFQMRGDYLSLLLFSTISTFCLFGFGMAIGGWAKDGNQAAPLSNLISFPMMFLSGVFFPRFLMPEWLQNVTAYIPLTPVVDGLRLILTEGQTILQLGPQLAVIGAWTLIIYIIAFKVFRWE